MNGPFHPGRAPGFAVDVSGRILVGVILKGRIHQDLENIFPNGQDKSCGTHDATPTRMDDGSRPLQRQEGLLAHIVWQDRLEAPWLCHDCAGDTTSGGARGGASWPFGRRCGIGCSDGRCVALTQLLPGLWGVHRGDSISPKLGMCCEFSRVLRASKDEWGAKQVFMRLSLSNT